MTARSQSHESAFAAAVAQVRALAWSPQILIEEIGSPQRIAPDSFAIGADIVVDGEDRGTGRLVLLHDPAGNEAWDGVFRCVTFAKAEVEPEMARDPLLPDVGWSWLTEALDSHQAQFRAPSGTVTALISTPFGGIQDEPGRAEVEIRASWTPILRADGLTPHLLAWQDLLLMVAGLPITPPGVVPLAPRRGRT